LAQRSEFLEQLIGQDLVREGRNGQCGNLIQCLPGHLLRSQAVVPQCFDGFNPRQLDELDLMLQVEQQ